MKIIHKYSKQTILTLGVYQILGGIIGLYSIACFLLRVQNISGGALLIFSIVVGLYLFSIKCGSLLIRKEYKRGIIYSIIHQLLQVIHISIGGNEFSYFSSSHLSFGPNFTNGFIFKIDFALASKFDISINVSEKEYYLYINLFAIIVGYLFWELYKHFYLKESNQFIKNMEKSDDQIQNDLESQ